MIQTAKSRSKQSTDPPVNGVPADPTAVAFRAAAVQLARWAWERYVIRDDAWGGYNPIAKREEKRTNAKGEEYVLGPTCTRPAKSKRGIVKLTLAVLEAHYRGRRPEDVAGAHTTN